MARESRTRQSSFARNYSDESVREKAVSAGWWLLPGRRVHYRHAVVAQPRVAFPSVMELR